MASDWPGIRPSGNGIRVTVWHKGETVYDKTHPGNFNRKADLKACVEFREDLIRRLKLGLPITEGDLASRRYFSNVAQGFLNSAQVDRGTRQDYKSKLNKHCLPHLGHLIFEEITRQQVIDAVAQWDLSISSKKAVLRVLVSVFRYGGRSDDNPAKGVGAGKGRKARIERYRPSERDSLLKAMTGHAQTFFAIFFGTGMRPGEILALEWADYDGETLWVEKQYTRGVYKGYTKTKRDRRVYVPTWVRPYIQDLDTRLEGKRLFRDKTTENVYSAWKEAHEKARVGAHRIRYRRPYTCRHTRAAELLSNGVTPAQAASELGHSPMLFLNTYSEFIEEFTERDLSRLEGANPQKTRNASTK